MTFSKRVRMKRQCLPRSETILPVGFDRLGREIQRVAVAMEVARSNRREARSAAPTVERLRHGDSIEIYDGAVAEAGTVGHRVVEACLLDALCERGVLGKGEDGLVRHSAGMWLRTLFHESGMVRAATMRFEGVQSGGDPTGAMGFETSRSASRKMALYQAAMRAMEQGEFLAGDARERPVARMTARQRRRATHAVREIACWDRWPEAFSAEEVRRAFDRLAAVETMEFDFSEKDAGEDLYAGD